MHDLEILAAAKLTDSIAEKNDFVPLAPKCPSDNLRRVVEHTDDAEDGGRVNRFAVCLVVKTHVAAGDRDVQCQASLRDAFNRLHELPHDFGSLRIAEIQAV